MQFEEDMADRLIIEKALETISLNLKELKQASDINRDVYMSDIRARRFIERTLHVIIEACIDIAHQIISSDNLREPSTYRDAFSVLCENGIIPESELPQFEKMAMFRNLLVHYYEKVDDDLVYEIFKNRLEDFEYFIKYILKYLDSLNF